MGRDFPHTSRPILQPTQPPINGYRVSFPGVKRPGRGVDHPPPTSAEFKERVELYLYSASGPSCKILEAVCRGKRGAEVFLQGRYAALSGSLMPTLRECSWCHLHGSDNPGRMSGITWVSCYVATGIDGDWFSAKRTQPIG